MAGDGGLSPVYKGSLEGKIVAAKQIKILLTSACINIDCCL